MLEFVEELLRSQDNIIDQLKVLKENKKNKEVKKYMRAFVKQTDSPYYKYCIDKYYYDKDVEEVKPLIHKLYPIYYLEGSDKVKKLLDSQDNIIDQIKVLKEHKGTKVIDNYIEEYLIRANQYTTYCIKKYYYDLDVEEVKPTAKSLNITLYGICFKSILKKQEKKNKKLNKKRYKKVKEGDKVKLLDGPFAGMIGIVKEVDKVSPKLEVAMDLFGQETICEYNESFEVMKEGENEAKNWITYWVIVLL